jgi:hypothetical protein
MANITQQISNGALSLPAAFKSQVPAASGAIHPPSSPPLRRALSFEDYADLASLEDGQIERLRKMGFTPGRQKLRLRHLPQAKEAGFTEMEWELLVELDAEVRKSLRGAAE